MKVYIFPRVNSKNDRNPYISLMEDTFKSLPDTSVISASGGFDQVILDLFRCLRSDLLVVNWPETLGNRRFPLAQLIVYALLLSLSSLLGIRILWVFHNKESHNEE